MVNGGSFYAKGFRSPTDWLMVTTREGVGFCKLTLHLADRIQRMPIVKAAFADGDLAESSLRLLAGAWTESVADVFASSRCRRVSEASNRWSSSDVSGTRSTISSRAHVHGSTVPTRAVGQQGRRSHIRGPQHPRRQARATVSATPGTRS